MRKFSSSEVASSRTYSSSYPKLMSPSAKDPKPTLLRKSYTSLLRPSSINTYLFAEDAVVRTLWSY